MGRAVNRTPIFQVVVVTLLSVLFDLEQEKNKSTEFLPTPFKQFPLESLPENVNFTEVLQPTTVDSGN
jgi:hypothetical protein